MTGGGGVPLKSDSWWHREGGGKMCNRFSQMNATPHLAFESLLPNNAIIGWQKYHTEKYGIALAKWVRLCIWHLSRFCQMNAGVGDCALMTSSETPPGGVSQKGDSWWQGGEGGSSQNMTSFINNGTIKGGHCKCLEMFYNYRKYQIITHFLFFLTLKTI